MKLDKKDLLGLEGMSAEAIELILDSAASFKDDLAHRAAGR